MLTKEEHQDIEETLSKCGVSWFSTQDEYSYDLYLDTGMEYALTPKILKAPKKSEEYAEYWPNEWEDKLITNAVYWLRNLMEENKQLKKNLNL